MFEVDVRVGPRLRRDAAAPIGELAGVVCFFAQPDVPPARGAHEWRLGVGGMCDAERGMMRAQHVVHLVVEPRVVAELERDACVARDQRQQRLQPRDVLLHVRRQTEQHRPTLLAERRHGAEQVRDRVSHLLQPPAMRYDARSLYREPEPGCHLTRPLAQRRFVRQAVERVVQLDRIETLGVVRQHTGFLHGFRVEAALPFLVRETARAGEYTHERQYAAARTTRPWRAYGVRRAGEILQREVTSVRLLTTWYALFVASAVTSGVACAA